MPYVALGAGYADVSQTRSSSLRTRVNDVVTRAVTHIFVGRGEFLCHILHRTFHVIYLLLHMREPAIHHGGEVIEGGGFFVVFRCQLPYVFKHSRAARGVNSEHRVGSGSGHKPRNERPPTCGPGDRVTMRAWDRAHETPIAWVTR
jgi:hypothetical protein